jgi:hypothetical protein
MIALLEKAFAEAAKLPEAEQEALAQQILAEIESEKQWDGLFAKSQDVLEKLGKEALMQHHAGKTRELDLDEL